MLFDAVAKKYDHAATVVALAHFAEDPGAAKDLRTFAVGSDADGFNTGGSAARHFFWSAFRSLSGNPLPALALGNIKETYDLLTSWLRLPRAGHFDVKDLDTNAAGRRLGLHVYQLWFDPEADTTGHIDLFRFTQTPARKD
jgi:hypothetical protein